MYDYNVVYASILLILVFVFFCISFMGYFLIS